MRFTSMTHPGGQKLNKDCFDKVCRNGVYCFVMSDGEGVGGEEASEIVVKAVIKAFEKMNTLKNNDYFKTWIIRILINECNVILR